MEGSSEDPGFEDRASDLDESNEDPGFEDRRCEEDENNNEDPGKYLVIDDEEATVAYFESQSRAASPLSTIEDMYESEMMEVEDGPEIESYHHIHPVNHAPINEAGPSFPLKEGAPFSKDDEVMCRPNANAPYERATIMGKGKGKTGKRGFLVQYHDKTSNAIKMEKNEKPRFYIVYYTEVKDRLLKYTPELEAENKSSSAYVNATEDEEDESARVETDNASTLEDSIPPTLPLAGSETEDMESGWLETDNEPELDPQSPIQSVYTDPINVAGPSFPLAGEDGEREKEKDRPELTSRCPEETFSMREVVRCRSDAIATNRKGRITYEGLDESGKGAYFARYHGENGKVRYKVNLTDMKDKPLNYTPELEAMSKALEDANNAAKKRNFIDEPTTLPRASLDHAQHPVRVEPRTNGEPPMKRQRREDSPPARENCTSDSPELVNGINELPTRPPTLNSTPITNDRQDVTLPIPPPARIQPNYMNTYYTPLLKTKKSKLPSTSARANPKTNKCQTPQVKLNRNRAFMKGVASKQKMTDSPLTKNDIRLQATNAGDHSAPDTGPPQLSIESSGPFVPMSTHDATGELLASPSSTPTIIALLTTPSVNPAASRLSHGLSELLDQPETEIASDSGELEHPLSGESEEQEPTSTGEATPPSPLPPPPPPPQAIPSAAKNRASPAQRASGHHIDSPLKTGSNAPPALSVPSHIDTPVKMGSALPESNLPSSVPVPTSQFTDNLEKTDCSTVHPSPKAKPQRYQRDAAFIARGLALLERCLANYVPMTSAAAEKPIDELDEFISPLSLLEFLLDESLEADKEVTETSTHGYPTDSKSMSQSLAITSSTESDSHSSGLGDPQESVDDVAERSGELPGHLASPPDVTHQPLTSFDSAENDDPDMPEDHRDLTEDDSPAPYVPRAPTPVETRAHHPTNDSVVTDFASPRESRAATAAIEEPTQAASSPPEQSPISEAAASTCSSRSSELNGPFIPAFSRKMKTEKVEEEGEDGTEASWNEDTPASSPPPGLDSAATAATPQPQVVPTAASGQLRYPRPFVVKIELNDDDDEPVRIPPAMVSADCVPIMLSKRDKDIHVPLQQYLGQFDNSAAQLTYFKAQLYTTIEKTALEYGVPPVAGQDVEPPLYEEESVFIPKREVDLHRAIHSCLRGLDDRRSNKCKTDLLLEIAKLAKKCQGKMPGSLQFMLDISG